MPQTNPSLPKNMHVRFVEIIYSDIEQLIKHETDFPFVSGNLRILRGLISSLALAYSDQDCPEFLSLLTTLQSRLPTAIDPVSRRPDRLVLLNIRSLLGTRLANLDATPQH